MPVFHPGTQDAEIRVELVAMDFTNEPVLFREVLECLARFPQREDTLQGITQWWLMENRVDWAVAEVQAALDELVGRGFVIAWPAADGQTRYRANPDAQEQIEALAGKGASH
jgi:hypothetical protein